MISESSFAAVFGAAVPGGEDSLLHLSRYAIRAGFAIVPCLPGTKQPMCVLPAREVKRADEHAKEDARQAGRPRWSSARHACGVKHAITEEKDSDRIIKRLIRDYGRVNLGVELGLSRVIVVDVDTDAEKEAFAASWFAATGEPLPFSMTVASPGVVGVDGVWKHKNGGHYWFSLPPGFRLPAIDGALKDESGWIAMWANRQVLVPPSVREEGPYLLTGDIHPAPTWLLARIVDYVTERQQRAAHQEARRSTRVEGEEPHIDAWSTATDWDVLLEPDGWFNTGLPDSCGCEIWTAPGVHASPKSATAHDVGCAAYDDSPGHAPLHVWTDNPPEFLLTGGKTFTKIQYVALRDHGGDLQLACRAEGIAREVQALVALPGVPAHLGGPIAVPTPLVVDAGGPAEMGHSEQLPADSSRFSDNSGTWPERVYVDSTGIEWVVPAGTSDAEAAAAGTYPTLEAAYAAGNAEAALTSDGSKFQDHGSTPEYETWAAENEDQLTDAELQERGYEPPRLIGLSTSGPQSLDVPPPPPIGDGAPAPVVDAFDPFENLVRSELQKQIVRAEADKRYTEIRYPYAARVASRGFQPMRDVVKAAAETVPEFLVEDWLRRGSYAVLGAEYKAGKTFLALDMGISIASGTPFLGIVPVKTGNVAMMHNEGDSLEFVDRLRAVAAAKGVTLTDEILDRLMFQEGASKLDRPEEVSRLYDNLAEFKPALTVIDPWYMSAGDEADGKTISKMGVVLGNLQGVAQEIGSALLVTAHWNKSGDGKGVSRWSGAGLAEWGRVLINVAVDRFTAARPYAEDRTRRTVVDLSITLSGQVSGSYSVHREVWRDDARDLSTPMRYLVTAREAEDANSENAPTFTDTTRSPRERLLRVFAAAVEGLTKSKAIATAKGQQKVGGRTLTVWNEAFDELLRDVHIEDVGEVDATTADGQLKAGGRVKYALTKNGATEIERIDQTRARAGSTARFVGLRPATTEEEKDHHE